MFYTHSKLPEHYALLKTYFSMYAYINKTKLCKQFTKELKSVYYNVFPPETI